MQYDWLFDNFIFNNYLLFSGSLFSVLSMITKNKTEWLTIAILSFLLLANKSIFDHNGEILYYVRGFATSIAAIILITRLTALGFYQGLILILSVIAYLFLAYDIATDSNLIFDNYGAVIHGLVFCQFLGVFPAIRNISNAINAGDNINRHNHNKGKVL